MQLPFVFGFRRPEGGSTLRRFKCSAEVNSACAEVLPAAKRSYGAKAPPARRPVGWFTYTFSKFQNIDFNRPLQNKKHLLFILVSAAAFSLYRPSYRRTHLPKRVFL